eukprot:GILK01001208.1.p1 GENE.GILK01001208.1~~GILK01001208.1.p1  ORF type:complete len:220 (-),score=32.08 GILK01001208.1:146-775(-)
MKSCFLLLSLLVSSYAVAPLAPVHPRFPSQFTAKAPVPNMPIETSYLSLASDSVYGRTAIVLVLEGEAMAGTIEDLSRLTRFELPADTKVCKTYKDTDMQFQDPNAEIANSVYTGKVEEIDNVRYAVWRSQKGAMIWANLDGDVFKIEDKPEEIAYCQVASASFVDSDFLPPADWKCPMPNLRALLLQQKDDSFVVSNQNTLFKSFFNL